MKIVFKISTIYILIFSVLKKSKFYLGENIAYAITDWITFCHVEENQFIVHCTIVQWKHKGYNPPALTIINSQQILNYGGLSERTNVPQSKKEIGEYTNDLKCLSLKNKKQN